MRYEAATIVRNEELAPGHWVIELAVTTPLPDIRAGQFLSLRCDPGDPHSLLRPFSILDADAIAGTLSVYYKHLGRLSTHLSTLSPGTQLACLYPLGQGFPWREDWRRVALVGGGVGLAPLLFWSRQLEPYGETMSVHGFFGGATTADLVPKLLASYDFPMELATIDGSSGHTGTVVDLFQRSEDYFAAIYGCGPSTMLAALKEALPEGPAAYASLEEYMACGVGACYGCPLPVRVNGEVQNLRVCKDGPVFALRSVEFS